MELRVLYTMTNKQKHSRYNPQNNKIALYTPHLYLNSVLLDLPLFGLFSMDTFHDFFPENIPEDTLFNERPLWATLKTQICNAIHWLIYSGFHAVYVNHVQTQFTW